jgi:hypothetical protein
MAPELRSAVRGLDDQINALKQADRGRGRRVGDGNGTVYRKADSSVAIRSFNRAASDWHDHRCRVLTPGATVGVLGPVGGEMTQQYLAGELSSLLGDLQAVATSGASARQLARLRDEAETSPLLALSSVAVRALLVTDDLCWESLTRADAGAFARQAQLGAELHEFGVCAGLLEDD